MHFISSSNKTKKWGRKEDIKSADSKAIRMKPDPVAMLATKGRGGCRQPNAIPHAAVESDAKRWARVS